MKDKLINEHKAFANAHGKLQRWMDVQQKQIDEARKRLREPVGIEPPSLSLPTHTMMQDPNWCGMDLNTARGYCGDGPER